MSDLIGRTPAGPTEMLTLGAAPQGLTVPRGATIALISIEGGPVRWRDDAPPSASQGQAMSPGERMLYGGALAALQFVAQDQSATVVVSYYR
jgi:hypothetical protein